MPPPDRVRPFAARQPCIGFGRHEAVCNQPADLDLNPAGLWCTRCEQLRRKTITAQMAKITEAFDASS